MEETKRIKTLTEEIDDMFNTLYQAERRMYIEKKLGLPFYSVRSMALGELEDEAWKEFTELFPFSKWRKSVEGRPDVIRKTRAMLYEKLDAMAEQMNRVYKCLDIISSSVDSIIEKTGLQTRIVNDAPFVFTDEEVQNVYELEEKKAKSNTVAKHLHVNVLGNKKISSTKKPVLKKTKKK